MTKTALFASRNGKELLRDPLNIAFGAGFPIVLLLLLSAIQANIPVSLFEIERLAPGIAVFGLSFISLFSATLISKDRTDSFMMRLFASPLTSANFIGGYTLPLIGLSALQSGLTLAFAFVLGLKPSVHILAAMAVLLPVAALYIGIGLLCGSLFTDKQVGGLCGALLTNLSAWLSGTWFDLDLVGGAFKRIADALPFVHAVDATRAAIAGNYAAILPDLWWVIGYAVAILAVAIAVFRWRIRGSTG